MFVLYEIKNKKTNFRYIGCSKNYEYRWERHLKDLNLNSHHNIHLQRAWNKYGKDSFEFSILKKVESEDLMFLEEVKLIETSKNLYNIAPGGSGGDLFTNHPNKDEYKKNLSISQRKRYKDPLQRRIVNPFYGITEEEREKRRKIWSDAKKGNKNNNFKHNTPVKQIDMVTGKLIKIWDYPSLVKEEGFNPKYVIKCCNKHPSYKSHKKFLWEWNIEDKNVRVDEYTR